MDRWKVSALVLGGMVVGMVYGSACSLSAKASGATGTRAVLYLSDGDDCPDDFSNVGRAWVGGASVACLED